MRTNSGRDADPFASGNKAIGLIWRDAKSLHLAFRGHLTSRHYITKVFLNFQHFLIFLPQLLFFGAVSEHEETDFFLRGGFGVDDAHYSALVKHHYPVGKSE